ncbi:MAG: YdeI/OmpD-associated family protein [Planctomycetota bacterium]|nr:YdeI/OmpD-associated family protein [Planctomycetota bacterium]
MKPAPEIYFPDRASLRAWLREFHASHAPIWLVYDKKRPGLPQALSYDDIVEEALCFGWIDSLPGRVDEARTKVYLCPRKARSVWSALNKRRIARLLELGLMTPAGQAKIDAAKADGSWTVLDAAEAGLIPDDLASALASNTKAKASFDAFPPGARKRIVMWVTAAKRAETRAKRVQTTVEHAAEGKRVVG